MAEDVWILGISMTKFGKHPDEDVIDLASQAVFGALADAQIGMKDVGVLAAGCLTGGSSAFGQLLQKQIGQTGIPVFNVANACATGLAVGVEKLSGAGLLAAPARKKDSDTWAPDGRLRAHVRGRLRGSKTPDRIEVWSEIQRTETGKLIRRHALARLTSQ